MPTTHSDERCPLCGSPSPRLLESIPGERINAAYRRSFGIEAGIVTPSLATWLARIAACATSRRRPKRVMRACTSNCSVTNWYY